MPRRPLPCRPALLLVLGCAAAGCRHGPEVVLHAPAPVEAWGIAVYPVAFRFPVPPFQAFQRGRALAEHVSAVTGRLVYGPGEFRIERLDDEDLQAATNLLAAVRFSKTRRPEKLVGLRVWVERRVTSGGAVVYDQAGKRRGARQADETDVAVHAELLGMGGRGVLAEAQGVARADPFSVEVEKDPFPDVTRLAAALVDALLAKAGLVPDDPPPDAGLRVLSVPAPALRFALPGAESLADELARLDPLDRDSRLLALWHQHDPTADRARLRLFRTATHGLVVLEAKGPAARAGLRPGDLLLAAGGEALIGRHVLDRHLAMGATAVRFRRAGEEAETTLAP